ncbi:DUF5519 family protein [Streptosporangiaceae bacterium NEAU-GS5]|nr:DUF5519 family protein [Streptosporangiaceae bacterium NEAU-GS5]
MSASGIAPDSQARRALTRLAEWPAIQIVAAGCGSGVGVGLAADPRQILHLHSDREAELCLTRTAIDRLHDALAETGAVGEAADGDWATVLLDNDRDIDLLLSLLSVALKAHAADGDRPLPPCSIQFAAQSATPARRRRRPRFSVRPHRP